MIDPKNSQIGFALGGLLAIVSLFLPLAEGNGSALYSTDISLEASFFFLCSAICFIAVASGVKPNLILLVASVVTNTHMQGLFFDGVRSQLIDFQWGIGALLMFTATHIIVLGMFFKGFEEIIKGKNAN